MSSDVIVCNETSCSSTDTFLCVKHCQQYVCFDHLQEHHRLYEKEKNGVPKELRRHIQQRFSLYNKLIDQTKLNEQEKRDIEIACTEIRRTYEQRRRDHHQLQTEGTTVLEPQSTTKDLNTYLEKLDVAIEREQQRERVYSNSHVPVNIKLEPNDFMDNENSNHQEDNHIVSNSLSNSRSLSTENKDNRSEDLWAEEGERSDINFSDIDEADSNNEEHQRRTTSTNHSSSSNLTESVTIHRGLCPLNRPGVFGILPNHNIRLCEGKSSCLYNHLQSFHHMTARSAYKVGKAVLKHCDPVTTVLFNSKDILYNKNFHIACPFNQEGKNPFDCQPKYILKAPCSSIISRLDMPRHLRDVHHVYRACALKIVAEMRRCSKSSGKTHQTMKLNRNLFTKHENIIEVIDDKANSRTIKLIKQRK